MFDWLKKKKQSPEEIFNDILAGKNTTFFAIGTTVFPHAPKTESELNEVATLIATDIWGLVKSPLHLIQFITFQIDAANIASNENKYAAELREFSDLYNFEFQGALNNSVLMDEEDSPATFMDEKISVQLREHFSLDESVRIRCLILKVFFNKYRKEINQARKMIAEKVIEYDTQRGNFLSAERWQKVIDDVSE